MRQFDVGDKVVFRESEDGPAELGEVTETFAPDDQYPNGGLYTVKLDVERHGSVEAFWTELTDRDEYCPESEDGYHQVTSGSCDQCGKKNFS